MLEAYSTGKVFSFVQSKASRSSFSSFRILNDSKKWQVEKKKRKKKSFGSYSDEMIVKIIFCFLSIVECLSLFFFSLLYHFEFGAFRFLLLWLLVAVLLFGYDFQRCDEKKATKHSNQSTIIIYLEVRKKG